MEKAVTAEMAGGAEVLAVSAGRARTEAPAAARLTHSRKAAMADSEVTATVRAEPVVRAVMRGICAMYSAGQKHRGEVMVKMVAIASAREARATAEMATRVEVQFPVEAQAEMVGTAGGTLAQPMAPEE